MKKNDVFILSATLCYSYLFYRQNFGLNFFLFSILLIVLLTARNAQLLSRPSWLAVAAGTLISSFFVFWWGTTLPVLAAMCSVSVLTALSFNPESSLLVALFNTGISVVLSIPRFMAGLVKIPAGQTANSAFLKKSLLLVIPVSISFLFVLVYRSANPIFKQLTDQINFDFISLDWCVYTTMAFFLMFGLFKIYAADLINDADKNATDELPFITLDEHLQKTDTGLSVANEVLVGAALFAMLNIVLCSVNMLDVFYMWIANKLPGGISLDAYVHGGANALIFSIVLAIIIILFVFRGYLNFYEKNKWLKALAYVWIAQNILLIITTANRNWWLIQSLGLTRRRIGVYVYLLLCLTGLLTTFIKVAQKKSNWFLFRKNAWVFYTVFVASCFINWDALIVNYNCATGNDRNYQAGLSYTSLTPLFKQYAAAQNNPNQYATETEWGMARTRMYNNYYYLKTEVESRGWQSFCVNKKRTLNAVDQIIKSGQLSPADNSR